MQNILTWQNSNVNADGIHIYRSTTPIILPSLPAVYDTIAGTATTYTDTNIVEGTNYYYMLGVFKGGDQILSSNINITAAKYTGNGPNTLQAGDMDAGFYGFVSPSSFISWDAFLAWSGVTLTSNSGVAAGSQYWLKFSHKGKTLMLPCSSIGTIAWQTLYNAGLIFGTNDAGPRTYNTLPAVNQYRTITVNNSQYIVRAMTSLPPGFDLTTNLLSAGPNNSGSLRANSGIASYDSYDTLLNLTGSEYDDLLMRVISPTPSSQRGANFTTSNDSITMLNGGNAYGDVNNNQIFQEMVSGQKLVTRGFYQNNYTYPGRTDASKTITTPLYWRPVLELVS